MPTQRGELADGAPLRVMTNDSPASSWRMISPLSFRSSRWVISLGTGTF